MLNNSFHNIREFQGKGWGVTWPGDLYCILHLTKKCIFSKILRVLLSWNCFADMGQHNEISCSICGIHGSVYLILGTKCNTITSLKSNTIVLKRKNMFLGCFFFFNLLSYVCPGRNVERRLHLLGIITKHFNYIKCFKLMWTNKGHRCWTTWIS